MNTEEYIESLDGDFRFEEMDRLYIDLPIELILNLVPEEYRNNINVKNFIKYGIVKNIRPVILNDNPNEFQSGYDFVYHNKTGLVFSGIQGQHAMTMTALYAVTIGIKNPDVFNLIAEVTEPYQANNTLVDLYTEFDDFQHFFIDELEGFFISSTMTRKKTKFLTISENYKLNKKEEVGLKGFILDFV